MGLVILRCVFLLVAAGVGVWFLNDPSGIIPKDIMNSTPWMAWAIFAGVLSLAVAVIAGDMAIRRKRLDAITAVYFGMLVGLFLTYVLGLALVPLQLERFRTPVQLVAGMVLCYTCISLLMQTRNDFRFIIPYVEFAKEVKGLKPCILDTSVVIDGRIADVVETRIFDGQLVMPKFVISELQAIADSSDRLRRGRGRRGLDILNRLRPTPTSNW